MRAVNENYYFNPKQKALICKHCGRGYHDYLAINKHLKERHYQILEKVI